ncbi:hypothetical protein ACFZCL_24425 [Streptomyces sp. NPDC008159]|uniref:hypothetical protein n=1 Tax=Streptomyces sp. NPDC008159 TaxID=3364817 RepID=UPI0036EDD507
MSLPGGLGGVLPDRALVPDGRGAFPGGVGRRLVVSGPYAAQGDRRQRRRRGVAGGDGQLLGDGERAPEGLAGRLSMEIIVMGDQLPEVRDHLAPAQREAGRGLIPMLMGGREEDVTEKDVDTLGKPLLTLMTGLIAQWTFDPPTAPEADELAEGLLRIIAATRGE